VNTPYVAGIVAALLVCVFIVEMLRRGILREKFAVLWLLVGFVLVVLAVFPQILGAAAELMGIQVPANLLFSLAGITLLLVSVQLSYEVSRLESRTRRLAEEIALMRQELGTLSDRLRDQESGQA
jgi:hypothetical protein